MIVIYKTGQLTYLIARRLVKLDRIALVNITAGKMLAPELIQGDATASNIAAEARGILSNQELALDIISHMHRVTDSLGTPGVGRRAAGIIREYLPC
jgi:lipid-A-disaccharide synthase